MRTPITVYIHAQPSFPEADLRTLFGQNADISPTFGGGFEITTDLSFSEAKRLLVRAYPVHTYYLAKVSIRTLRIAP